MMSCQHDDGKLYQKSCVCVCTMQKNLNNLSWFNVLHMHIADDISSFVVIQFGVITRSRLGQGALVVVVSNLDLSAAYKKQLSRSASLGP
eukprot:m.241152 g.241152  ORF g.241152 m.241152 type:complete len:90 (+) comp33769_c0_seq9:126-395(+)